MAAAAAATIAAAAAGSDDADDFLRVYRAVSSGAGAEELRRVIIECAQGIDQRRKQAVNQGETPLQAAHRQKRGDLVGALVEAGADVRGLILTDRELTPLAVCIAYGQVESVRALLRAGHNVQGKIDWIPSDGYYMANPFSTPVHFCLAPPPLGLPSNVYITGHGAPQLGCLEVLLREGGADVNARDCNEATPIHWLARYGEAYDDEQDKAARGLLVSAGARTAGVFDNGLSPLMTAVWKNTSRFVRFLIEVGAPVNERSPCDGITALHRCCWGMGDEMAALVLDAGADVNARDGDGETPLFHPLRTGEAAITRLLLDRGARVDVSSRNGGTPLIAACMDGVWLRDNRWSLFKMILRRSSDQTRRSLLYQAEDEDEDDDEDEEQNEDRFVSAVDHLASDLDQRYPPSNEAGLRVQRHCCWAIAELLASGVPLRPDKAALALPVAAELSARQEVELAARHAELRSWRARETFVGVSLDVKELRAAEREVEEKRARVVALERELGEPGETEGDESDESDESEESGDESDDGGGGLAHLTQGLQGLGAQQQVQLLSGCDPAVLRAALQVALQRR